MGQNRPKTSRPCRVPHYPIADAIIAAPRTTISCQNRKSPASLSARASRVAGIEPQRALAVLRLMNQRGPPTTCRPPAVPLPTGHSCITSNRSRCATTGRGSSVKSQFFRNRISVGTLNPSQAVPLVSPTPRPSGKMWPQLSAGAFFAFRSPALATCPSPPAGVVGI